MKARFIQENQALGLDLSYRLLEGFPLGEVAFFGNSRLFLRVILRRLQVSLNTLTVGLTPVCSFQACASVSRVQSVREATSSRNVSC